jgi:hypothetical protein
MGHLYHGELLVITRGYLSAEICLFLKARGQNVHIACGGGTMGGRLPKSAEFLPEIFQKWGRRFRMIYKFQKGFQKGFPSKVRPPRTLSLLSLQAKKLASNGYLPRDGAPCLDHKDGMPWQGALLMDNKPPTMDVLDILRNHWLCYSEKPYGSIWYSDKPYIYISIYGILRNHMTIFLELAFTIESIDIPMISPTPTGATGKTSR